MLLRRSFAGRNVSFMSKAAQDGAKSLIGPYPSNLGRFDEVLKHVSIDKMEADEVECSFTVQESCVNSIGTMHGGFTATLVDVVGTLALLARQQDKPGVSVDINVSYLSGVRVGDKVRCVGKVLRMGNSLGFTNVDLFRQDNGKLVATGRHTKAFPKNMVPT